MTIFDKNVQKLPHLLDYLPNPLPDLPKLNFEGETLIQVPNYTINRATYIAVDILSESLLKEAAQNMSGESLFVIWYLDATSLQLAIESIDFTTFDNQPIILCGHPSNERQMQLTEGILKRIIYYVTNIEFMVKASQNAGFIAQCKELINWIGNYNLNFQHSLGNSPNDTLLGLRNNIHNFPMVLKSVFMNDFIEEIKPLYQGKPAVIIASGPSLDKNIHLLKDYQKKALLLCCDGSLKAIQRQKITPDIVGTVERGYITYDKFYRNKPIEDQVFFGPSIVNKHVVEDFAGRQILCHKENGGFSDLFDDFTGGKVGLLEGGSSVAHLLFHLAEAIECDPIILIGQDLAYTKDGITHTKDAEIVDKEDIAKLNETVLSIDGELLPTTPILKMFLKHFENHLAKHKLNVIDSTEGGAKIEGTKIKPLSESLGNLKDIEKVDMLSLVRAMYTKFDDRTRYHEMSISRLEILLKKMIDFNEIVSKAQKKNTKAFSIVENGAKTQAQLNRIYDTLDSLTEDVVDVMINDQTYLNLFQYTIRKMYTQVSLIPVDNFSLETLETNLIIHKNFLKTLSIFTFKTMRVLIMGIEHLLSEFKINNYDKSLYIDYMHIIDDDDLKLQEV